MEGTKEMKDLTGSLKKLEYLDNEMNDIQNDIEKVWCDIRNINQSIRFYTDLIREVRNDLLKAAIK